MKYRYTSSRVQLGLCKNIAACFCRLQKGKINDEKQCHATGIEVEKTATPEVARWIEERDILLKTGVYIHNGITIQQ